MKGTFPRWTMRSPSSASSCSSLSRATAPSSERGAPGGPWSSRKPWVKADKDVACQLFRTRPRSSSAPGKPAPPPHVRPRAAAVQRLGPDAFSVRTCPPRSHHFRAHTLSRSKGLAPVSISAPASTCMREKPSPPGTDAWRFPPGSQFRVGSGPGGETGTAPGAQLP